MADVFDIAGRINSTSNEHVVTTADQIKDENKNKKQSQINAETISELATHESRLNAYTEGKFVTVDTYSGLPATGVVDTVYRVSSWDGTANSGQGAVDVTKYSEYAWENGAYKFLDVKTQIGEVFDISEYNNDTYIDLEDALSGTNVPQAVKRGGMTVKFVQRSDNKYVQYRYMGTAVTGTPNPFLNTDNWINVEVEVNQLDYTVGKSTIQSAALTVSGSNQTIRVDLDNANKGTFKIIFDGGSDSVSAAKMWLYKDALNEQGLVYVSSPFGFNQQIEYSGDEFNIAYFTVYANNVEEAGDATIVINTGMAADIESNKNKIESSEEKNLSTMFYTKGYLLNGGASYDANGIVISSTVKWSDGVNGSLTRSLWDDNALEYTRDVVTHGAQSIQYDRIYNIMGEISKETIIIS